MEKKVMEKAYWGVESVYGMKGCFILAHLHVRSGMVKPRDKRHSRENGVVFFDWFETEEEAVSYLDDVKGCADARNRAAY
jgi:hypothetical protein